MLYSEQADFQIRSPLVFFVRQTSATAQVDYRPGISTPQTANDTTPAADLYVWRKSRRWITGERIEHQLTPRVVWDRAPTVPVTGQPPGREVDSAATGRPSLLAVRRAGWLSNVAAPAGRPLIFISNGKGRVIGMNFRSARNP